MRFHHVLFVLVLAAFKRSNADETAEVGGPRVTMSNGVRMPMLGFGTWQANDDNATVSVRSALDVGYRLIDTASLYKNEEDIGRVLQEYMKDGKMKREDIFITTKLWADQLNPAEVERNTRNALTRLQMEYVDLLLVHVPDAWTPEMNAQDRTLSVVDIWKAFEDVYQKKLAKSIGVSNFNGDQIDRVMKTCTVPIHNLQVELHIYWPQKELVELCRKHNISVTAYAPLGSPGRPEQLRTPLEKDPLKDENVKTLAEKYKKTPAQILIRYILDRDIAVIPKAVKPKHIAENFAVFDFKLTPEEMKLLESSGYTKRTFIHDHMIGHPEDAFKAERQK